MGGTGTPASAVALNTAMDGAVDPATLRGAQPQELTAQEKCACIHDNESGLFPGVFDCHRFAEDTCEKFKGVCELPCKPKKDPRSHNSRYGVYVPHSEKRLNTLEKSRKERDRMWNTTDRLVDCVQKPNHKWLAASKKCVPIQSSRKESTSSYSPAAGLRQGWVPAALTGATLLANTGILGNVVRSVSGCFSRKKHNARGARENFREDK